MKPATPVDALFPLLPALDLALVMSVEPGFGGQAFMPESLSRVGALKAEIERQGVEVEIEIDGGINTDNAGQAVAAGWRCWWPGLRRFGRGGWQRTWRR